MRIVPTGFRYTRDALDGYHVKLTVTNRSAIHCTAYVQVKLFADGVAVADGDGRDAFVILTQQRVAEKKLMKEYKPETRKRFNLGPKESKEMDLITVNRHLSEATIVEEVSPINLPIDNYTIEITIMGAAHPWSGNIQMESMGNAVVLTPAFRLPTDYSSLCLNKVPTHVAG